MILYIIRKLFLAKEIKSKAGVLHFQRWRILATPWFAINIHRIFKPDDDKFLHDHPWNYFGLILNGSYDEQYCNVIVNYTRTLQPGNYGFNKAERFHKILKLNTPSVTTLFITGRRRRECGYQVGNCWVQNEKYRTNKDKITELCGEFLGSKSEDQTGDIRLLK